MKFSKQFEAPIEAKLRQRVTGGFTVAVLLTVFLGFSSWHNARLAADDADWVAHTYAVMDRIELTSKHVIEAETSARTFAWTGQDSVLAHYETSRSAIAQDEDALRHLTADNPNQQRRLDVLEPQVRAALEFAESMVAKRRQMQAVPGADDILETERLMDAVRVTTQEMRAGEMQLLSQRTLRTKAGQRLTSFIIVAGILVGAGLLAMARLAVNREVHVSARARAQVNALNADLERRVAQRTAALGESEGRLAGVIQSAMDAILTVDEQHLIVLFNAAAEKMFRCPATEALGQPITRFIPQRFHAAHAGHIRKFGETGDTNRAMGPKDVLWAVRADGQEFQIEASISQVVTGGRKLFTVILRDVTERVLATEARERLAAIVESSDDAIISKTLDGTITAWNHGAEKVFGYSSSEAVGKSMRMLLPPERANEETDILSRIGRGESVEHFETVRVRKDGKRIDVSVTISPIRDNSGVIGGASKVARDITERKRVEEALREQSQVMDSAQVFVRDMESRVVFWPRGAEKLYGFNSQEALGILSHDLFHTQFPEPLERIEKKLFETGVWEGELIHRKRDGSTIVVSSAWALHRDVQGRPVRILETNTDITDRKLATEQLAGQAEELARSRLALEEQTLMLQSVLNSMTEGLATADEQGKFVLWNTAAEKILGMGAADLPSEKWTEHYGLFLTDTVTPFPCDQIPLVRAIRGEVSTTEMFVRNPKLAQGAWIEVCAGPLKDRHGVVCGGVAAFRDITRSRADEREIRKLNDELEIRVMERTAQLAAANKELEAFSYSVSHDLRAPLRHIIGFSQLLVEEFGPTLAPEAQRYLERIQAGTQKMGLLVDELLNLARVGRHALNLRTTKLNELVAEVVAMMQPDCEGRQVEWMIADLSGVECDPVLVKQVFQNLLANALKFTRPRTHAVIEVSHKENAEDGQPVFMVRDNGIGFDMKYVDKLFGVFQRLHRPEDFEGTGIGLATVQRIVHKHGGQVWAEGNLDKGAAFYFTLGAGKQAESKSDGATAGGQL